MKRALIYLAIFTIAFLFGSIIAGAWLRLTSIAESFDPKAVTAIETEQQELPVYDRGEFPEFDPNIDYDRSIKVKLLQSGNFHSEEVPYRSGERWLGLFRNGENYELRPTTIRIRRSEDDELFDTEVTTTDKGQSILLLRGADELKPGKVDTVFDVERDGEFDLQTGMGLGLRGTFWKLWVENASPEGFLQKGSALIVQKSGYDPQVLRTLPEGCDDCGWRLLWAGDIDQDSNLDFLIDVSGHYNVYQPTLFLSSSGLYRTPVGLFATFAGVGC